jgi:hypothetical protein
LAVAVLLAAARATAQEVPPQYQAVLFLKALAYDHALPERVSGSVRVLVLFRPDQPESQAAARDVAASMVEAGKTTKVVGGLPVEVREVPYIGLVGLGTVLAEKKTAAVFVCPGLENNAVGIASLTRRIGVMSGGGSEALARGGLTLGLGTKGGKATLFVNLTAAKAEGVRLDSNLLRLAQVIP